MYKIIALLFSMNCFAEVSIYENVSSQRENGQSLYERNSSPDLNATGGYLDSAQAKKSFSTELETGVTKEGYGDKDYSGQTSSFDIKNLDKISYSDSQKFFQKVSKLSSYHTGLSLYTLAGVESPLYKKIFVDSTGARQVGSLIFSLDQKLLGDRFTLNYITGVGVSYFKGRGFFVDDDSESEARLTLWLIPVDFGLAGAMSFNGYARLLMGAGVSGVVAVQSRSDVEEDEPNTFQFGFGPFLTTKLNIGMNKIFPKFSLGMFRDYGVTNSYLNVEYRFQHYSNFQSDFAVKGSSIGVGLSFDFI